MFHPSLARDCLSPCSYLLSLETDPCRRDIVAAILRIYYLIVVSPPQIQDSTWAGSGTFQWSIIEPSLGVIVCCSPTLGPIVQNGFNRLKGSSSREPQPSSNPAEPQARSTSRGGLLGIRDSVFLVPAVRSWENSLRLKPGPVDVTERSQPLRQGSNATLESSPESDTHTSGAHGHREMSLDRQ